MDLPEQINHLALEIGKVIDRCRAEYDLPYAAVIGVLHTHATMLVIEAKEGDEGEDPKY